MKRGRLHSEDQTSVGPIDRVIELLTQLPGVGSRTATRYALHMLKGGKGYTAELAQALQTMAQTVRFCSQCMNLSESDPCSICRDQRRDHSQVCVLESIPDLLAVQRTHEYRGTYYVLHGAINPLENILPDNLLLEPLLKRVKSGQVHEVILATSSNLPGETTALYLQRLLKPYTKVKVTRIAFGLPAGSDLELSDPITLTKALQHRSAMS